MCATLCLFFFFKQKTAYEMRISDWSSDVCSSDLEPRAAFCGLCADGRGGAACAGDAARGAERDRPLFGGGGGAVRRHDRGDAGLHRPDGARALRAGRWGVSGGGGGYGSSCLVDGGSAFLSRLSGLGFMTAR